MTLLIDPLDTGAKLAVATIFPPMNKGFAWVFSTTGPGGVALPAGEVVASVTIGIRPDGNATYALGNYQYQIIVAAPTTAETLAQLNAALGSTLPPGNYWANAMQTDTYNGANEAGGWGAAESPFSILAPAVPPSPPTLSVN